VTLNTSTLDFTVSWSNLAPGGTLQVDLEARLATPGTNAGADAFEELASGTYAVSKATGDATEADICVTRVRDTPPTETTTI
jgi:hypothetical protein